MAIRALFFDLDGTLVDTIRDITEALNYALRVHNLRELSIDETKGIIGEGATRMIEKAVGTGNERLRDAVRDVYLQYYRDHLIDFSAVYPGVKETLENLHSYRKAVISNKRAFLSTAILEKVSLLGYFTLVVGSDTVAEKKPSAEPLSYALERFQAKPREGVMVGDSTVDIAAGKQAGVRTIAVTYGYQEKDLLGDADYRIDRFEDLPVVLDRLSAKFL